MRKRINNDFDALAEVLHEGVKIDLSLYEITSVRLVSNQAYQVTDYEIRNGSLFLHVTPLIVPKLGKYKIVVTYRIADPTLADGFWNYEFDKYLVTIVGSSEEEDAGEVVITADAVIGMQGKSAYQVWLEAGNTGTVEDYLADIKGDSFLYSDFLPEQLEALKVKGDKGDAFTYEDFTPEQIASLKGDTGNGIQSITLTSTVGLVKTYTITFTDLTTTTFEVTDGADGHSPVITFVGTTIYVDGVAGVDLKGDKGDPFLYSDFTPEQLEALKVKGDKGDPFLYSDFTPEQLESLKVKGDSFTYEDFTPEQLEALKVKGDKGDPLTYADLTEANKDDLRQPIYDDLLSIIYAGL